MMNECFYHLKIAMRIPLLLFAMCIVGLASVNGQSNITSRIAGQLFNDQTGEPLGGASISINSFPAGALLGRGLSADDGTFSIMLKTADSVRITINYVGFAGRSIVTPVRQGIQIRLTPVSTELNSAVVIGYGKVKRKDLTGSVGQVQMGDIMKAPVRSFE